MKYYVIAGTKEQFNGFILAKSLELFAQGHTSISLSHFVYVSSPDVLRGVRDPHGWFYGTWQTRQDILDILIQLRLQSKNNETIERLAGELMKKMK